VGHRKEGLSHQFKGAAIKESQHVSLKRLNLELDGGHRLSLDDDEQTCFEPSEHLVTQLTPIQGKQVKHCKSVLLENHQYDAVRQERSQKRNPYPGNSSFMPSSPTSLNRPVYSSTISSRNKKVNAQTKNFADLCKGLPLPNVQRPMVSNFCHPETTTENELDRVDAGAKLSL